MFGTETHMTAIVGMALGHRPIPNQPPVAAHTANFLLNSSGSTSVRRTLPAGGPTGPSGPDASRFKSGAPGRFVRRSFAWTRTHNSLFGRCRLILLVKPALLGSFVWEPLQLAALLLNCGGGGGDLHQ